MQEGKHGTITDGVEEFIRMPAGCQRACFRLSISHDAANEQVRVVECRSVRMREGIAQLAAFVNRAGSFGRDMARNSPRERELLEQLLHPVFRLRDTRIEFACSTLQI